MRRHKGFSLLEILVAFAIMAVALTIVLRIFGSGINNAVISEDYTIAVQIAESLMARTGVETILEIGDATGVVGNKYSWVVSTSLLDQTLIDQSGQPQQTSPQPQIGQPQQTGQSFSLYAITVKVFWDDEGGSERVFALRSLKTF